MNKTERQAKIRQLIQTGHISTQEAIKTALQAEGIRVTQATLSRDLREIGLLKRRDADGKLYYTLSSSSASRFTPVIRSYILKVARAEFILVLHTNLGEADVLANLIDSAQLSDLLGTVAGADTLLLICRDSAAAAAFEQDLLAGL
ncbi:arginine repressor [Streptococcus pantholopis]|uniref:Arginine repressor n=1 Tax=Streptococcus pantholopis TaxID=1811193 RepID=A0A172Q9S3_9STRE|nr:arginine repressor [Streptococcus pantholopis]AND80182.1 arginine repressor [Streptococcus pantholopis]